ncbi:hypothetical protein ACFQS7_04800 [Dankookia sp. GCM10030260]
MSVALRHGMSLAGFDGYRPVAMTGGTAGHARIQRNLMIAARPAPSTGAA